MRNAIKISGSKMCECLLSDWPLLGRKTAFFDRSLTLVRHGRGFFSLLEEGEEESNDDGVYEWFSQRCSEAYFNSSEAHWENEWTACIDENTKRRGFSFDAKGFSVQQCSWVPERGFSAVYCTKGQACVRIRLN